MEVKKNIPHNSLPPNEERILLENVDENCNIVENSALSVLRSQHIPLLNSMLCMNRDDFKLILHKCQECRNIVDKYLLLVLLTDFISCVCANNDTFPINARKNQNNGIKLLILQLEKIWEDFFSKVSFENMNIDHRASLISVVTRGLQAQKNKYTICGLFLEKILKLTHQTDVKPHYRSKPKTSKGKKLQNVIDSVPLDHYEKNQCTLLRELLGTLRDKISDGNTDAVVGNGDKKIPYRSFVPILPKPFQHNNLEIENSSVITVDCKTKSPLKLDPLHSIEIGGNVKNVFLSFENKLYSENLESNCYDITRFKSADVNTDAFVGNDDKRRPYRSFVPILPKPCQHKNSEIATNSVITVDCKTKSPFKLSPLNSIEIGDNVKNGYSSENRLSSENLESNCYDITRFKGADVNTDAFVGNGDKRRPYRSFVPILPKPCQHKNSEIANSSVITVDCETKSPLKLAPLNSIEIGDNVRNGSLLFENKLSSEHLESNCYDITRFKGADVNTDAFVGNGDKRRPYRSFVPILPKPCQHKNSEIANSSVITVDCETKSPLKLAPLNSIEIGDNVRNGSLLFENKLSSEHLESNCYDITRFKGADVNTDAFVSNDDKRRPYRSFVPFLPKPCQHKNSEIENSSVITVDCETKSPLKLIPLKSSEIGGNVKNSYSSSGNKMSSKNLKSNCYDIMKFILKPFENNSAALMSEKQATTFPLARNSDLTDETSEVATEPPIKKQCISDDFVNGKINAFKYLMMSQKKLQENKRINSLLGKKLRLTK